MDYRQFTNAILAGANQGAPASNNSVIGNAFTGAFRGAAVARPGNAQGVASAQQADDEEKARRAAAEARARELQDKLDPSKYQKIRKDDGGFSFFDPSGKEIDIDTYAKRTGQRRVDVIKDSDNPIDQQFIDDYNQMNDLNQAVWRNDTAALAEYKSMFPDLFSRGGGINPTPEDITKKLLEKYPHIYGMGNYQKSLSNLGNPLFRTGSSSSSSSSGRRSGLSL